MPIAPVKQLCVPSDVVKSDSLVEQVAQIEDFASGRVDGRAFFRRNHFTQGLELLVRRGFERLAGKSEDGAFYLTQAMGGGKTHSLIAFGLLAADSVLRREVVPKFASGAELGTAKVVIFNGHQNPETLLWGYIAEQLGSGDVMAPFWRQETFFAAITKDDLARESRVEAIVRENLTKWQQEGLVPDMLIEAGDKTDELIRTRGWTHWHHLFCPRQITLDVAFLSAIRRLTDDEVRAALLFSFKYLLDKSARLSHWRVGSPAKTGRAPSADAVEHVFYNQAFNTFYNYGARALPALDFVDSLKMKNHPLQVPFKVTSLSAKNIRDNADLFITDPPYADSVKYEEITEFFIAWLRGNLPKPFKEWVWDSSRNEAIKGSDENFRREMVAAYATMTQNMSGNGIQVVMFTHQDAGVWADLGAILWAAGLSVAAAWNVVTEIAKPTGEGNYVQGTICLVLRKRLAATNARRMEIEAEIELAVEQQLARLTELGDASAGETLYTDGDLTLAAYAAALRVVTSYSTIDRQPLDRDLYRKLPKWERTMIRDLVEYAAQVANGLLVPVGFPRDAWRDLGASERFYVRMLDMEAKGATKVADFQNFAKSFAYGDYASLMASTAANAARLAGAVDLKGRMLDGDGFAKTQLRQVLFAIWKTLDGPEGDPKRGVTILKTEYAADYWQRRQKLIGLAEYVAAKTRNTRPNESAAAHELAEALKVDRV